MVRFRTMIAESAIHGDRRRSRAVGGVLSVYRSSRRRIFHFSVSFESSCLFLLVVEFITSIQCVFLGTCRSCR